MNIPTFLVHKLNIKTFYDCENTLNNINTIIIVKPLQINMFLRPRHRLRTPPLRSFVKIIGVGSGYSRLMIQCACLTQSTLSIEKCNMSSSNTYIYYHFCKYCNIEKLKIRDMPLSGSKDGGRDSHS